ncbi:MAG: TonB-dependent receptor [Opitutus sp.]|nr:TonB-dependent receptor [Opitutus sp.]
MNLRCSLLFLTSFFLATRSPAVAQAVPPAGEAKIATTAGDEVVRISPFEVSAQSSRGFYASNTLSGTRLNSKLEDLGSSITVVTKQQMEDFALKDINDIFLYEANTEGTGNFTDYSVDRNGFVVDNTTGGLGGGTSLGGTTGANRIRGIKQANVAIGNFATSGRVPVDTFTVDSVEISRGPNSSIFGLGNASGTLNILPARANLRSRKTSVELRADSFDGTRAAVAHNQPLIPGKLAIRGAAITQDNRFDRKPSVDHSTRYDGMITYQPFKNTTLRASYERYANFARLPNSVTPRDGIGYWLDNGSPTWDPITSTVHRKGTSTVVPFNATLATEAAQLGPGLSSDSNVYTRSNLYVNGDGSIGLWSVGRLSSAANPATVAGNVRLIQSATYPRTGLDATTRSITNRALYDWSSINLLAANWSRQVNNNVTVELEQFFLNTPRHLLALQAGWYQEDSTLYRWDSIGQSSESPLTIFMDVNERLLDGATNPYFLRPYVGAAQPTNFYQPFRRNIYRGQLVYQLKLADERNWRHWVGDHSFSGYYEYNRTFTGGYSYRDAILSTHSWLPVGTDRSNGTNAARIYNRYYLGDSTGNNVDYGTKNWLDGYGPGTYRWFNGATNQWVNEPATLGGSYRTGTTGSRSDTNRTQTLLKTKGGTWQGHLLGDRIVATLGLREDRSFSRNGTNLLAADGYSLDPSNQSVWPGAWELRSGRTTTKGVVVKPFRGIRTLDTAATQAGPKGLAAQVLQSLNLHYNQSDSFLPEALRQDLFTNLLPDPTGKGKDYGFSLNFLNDKLVVRYNQYDTSQLNSRESQNGTIASRVARVEMNYNGNNDPLNLTGLASTWVDRLQPGLTGTARDAAIAKYTGLPPDRPGRLASYVVGATSDVVAKGKEIEVNYNPTRFWTMKLTVAQQKSIDAGISQELLDYLAARLPFWTGLIDPIRGTPWYTTDYGGSRPTPKAFLTELVYDPIKLAQANEGKTRTQVREWRSNLLATYRLAGITENRWLKKVSLTGAIRWEDKASIGYYADAKDPTIYDPNRPIYSKGNTYIDLGTTYRTRILADKIQLRVQLNVRNAFEGGRLQAIGALPDGTPHTYRIVDPRLFMLTATFDL